MRHPGYLGVGQSEVEIFKSAHKTVVIVVLGLGDEIQAIKEGIMEITDVFVVNKIDLLEVDRKVADIDAMLDLNEKLDINNEYIRRKSKKLKDRQKNETALFKLTCYLGKIFESHFFSFLHIYE